MQQRMVLKSDNVRDRSRDAAREIRRFIEKGVEKGLLAFGDKLPNERMFAEQFLTGRNTVRKILITLEEEGKISRHVGRGTFVTMRIDQESAGHVERQLAQKEAQLLPVNVLEAASPLDLMEFRILVEPAIAELSSLRAGVKNIDRMQGAVDRSRVSKTLQEFEDCDDELHKAIAEATRNPLFVAISQMISFVRTSGEWGFLKERTLTQDARAFHLSEHVRIVQAIRQRDAATARREMQEHLDGIRESMMKL